MTIIVGIQSGERTHHQDQLILPNNFRVINKIARTPQKPIPLLACALFAIFSSYKKAGASDFGLDSVVTPYKELQTTPGQDSVIRVVSVPRPYSHYNLSR